MFWASAGTLKDQPADQRQNKLKLQFQSFLPPPQKTGRSASASLWNTTAVAGHIRQLTSRFAPHLNLTQFPHRDRSWCGRPLICVAGDRKAVFVSVSVL